MVFPIASVIAAGGSLLGGILGQSAQNARAEKNDALQREFAQTGIQWKVEDARKAGVHPLAALGAQTASYTPQSIGDSIGPAFAQAGQDISRAVDATRSGPQRVEAIQKSMDDLTLTRMGLENELLASQIAKINQAGHPPPFPVGGLAPGAEPVGGTAIAAGHPAWQVGNRTPVDFFSQVYGEPGEWAFGVPAIVEDAFRNAVRVRPGSIADKVRLFMDNYLFSSDPRPAREVRPDPWSVPGTW